MRLHTNFLNNDFGRSWRLPICLLSCLLSLPLWAADTCEDPPRLSFSVIPEGNVQQDLKKFRPLLNRIAKATGKPVETIPPSSYGMVIEGLLGGAIDIAMLGPASYVVARKADAGILPLAAMDHRAGTFHEAGAFYHSLLITARQGNIQTIEALRGTRLAMVDPNSTSGSVIPRHYFASQAGLPMEKYFQRIAYTGNHPKSALAVLNGTADAAFVSSYQLSMLVRSGKAKASDFTILWRSPPIPRDPIVLRSKLCKKLAATIRAVILDAPASTNRDVLEAYKATRFIPINDSDYQIIRSLPM